MERVCAGVAYQIQETAESAYLMDAQVLRALVYDEIDVEQATDDIRRRDAERRSEQAQDGLMPGHLGYSDALAWQLLPRNEER